MHKILTHSLVGALGPSVLSSSVKWGGRNLRVRHFLCRAFVSRSEIAPSPSPTPGVLFPLSLLE